MRAAFLLAIVLCLASPVSAELIATDQCDGQPTGTSADMGPIDVRPAIADGAQDNIDADLATGCSNMTGFDSVTCFGVESACSSTFTIGPNIDGNAAVAISVVIQPASGTCSNNISNCDARAEAVDGNSATTPEVDIPAGSLVCLYTTSTVSNSAILRSSADLADCGAFPVELESFSVD